MSSVAECAPSVAEVTPYDQAHARTYLRILDAEAGGAAWEEVARLVLGMDPENDPERARRCFETHLERARWMATQGYLEALKYGGA